MCHDDPQGSHKDPHGVCRDPQGIHKDPQGIHREPTRGPKDPQGDHKDRGKFMFGCDGRVGPFREKEGMQQNASW